MEGTVVGSCDRSFKDPSRRYHQSKKKKLFISFIIYSTHYHFSDWPKAYSEFSKSAPGTSSSCSMII